MKYENIPAGNQYTKTVEEHITKQLMMRNNSPTKKPEEEISSSGQLSIEQEEQINNGAKEK